jgi:hypothetical protein
LCVCWFVMWFRGGSYWFGFPCSIHIHITSFTVNYVSISCCRRTTPNTNETEGILVFRLNAGAVLGCLHYSTLLLLHIPHSPIHIQEKRQ